ncbi:MAG: hypothetical protein K9H49_17740 [Bacteroidales bacterium]|nr:hypothetical protein [Bacteroidales bacterium]MCF8391457.1 hypothetical protein [Bacteroidales bacterium]
MKYFFTRHRFIRHLPMYPFIYGAAFFIFILDIWIELYHRIAFPLYGIKYIRRRDYIKIDRHKLSYLHAFQKINCVYCGYANGAIKYFGKIIAETEIYWCGIQHDKREGFIVPEHHKDFIEYGNEEKYKEVYASKKTRML